MWSNLRKSHISAKTYDNNINKIVRYVFDPYKFISGNIVLLSFFKFKLVTKMATKMAAKMAAKSRQI